MATQDHIFRSPSGWGFSISWPAIIVGALVAVATSFTLLTLGTGIGLALYSTRVAAHPVAFFSLSAAYFVAVEAIGFAFGGHIAGRLCGELIGTQREEDMRAGLHGLLVWAVAALFAALLIGLGGSSLAATLGMGAAGALGDDADNVRRAASFATTWTGIALLFGGVVAVTGAVYARIEEDRLPASKRA